MKITANGVTLVRMALVPLPSAMLLTAELHWVWIGFFLATVLGATDAVDGYMARRDGPTVLGALLDPFADKLFTAAFFLPIVALGHAPAWIMAAIFAREMLITSLRSSMELHQARLKTSQLGKLKTVVQMGGLAVYVFTVFPPAGYGAYLHIAALVALALVGVIFVVRGGKAPYWVVAGLPMWAVVFALSLVLEPLSTVFWLFAIVMAMTWVSGFDYLAGSWKTFRARGLTRPDVVRVIWSLLNGTLPVLVVGLDKMLVVPALIGLGASLALGGIDNVVAAERKVALRGGFSLATLVALAFFGVVWWTTASGGPALASVVAAWSYVAITLGCAVVSFVAYRELFFTKPTPIPPEPSESRKEGA